MTSVETSPSAIRLPEDDVVIDDAQLAAVAFLTRYRGRTLDAYRHDLRGFFQWASDNNLDVLAATRPHIELYRSWMEDRGLAASTIDRRLSTACGFYRFAHIDGRISSNPAQYVRRPQVHPSNARGLDRSELGVFLYTAEQYDRDHAALAVLLGLNGLRVSEACATNVEDLGLERGHRTLRSVRFRGRPVGDVEGPYVRHPERHSVGAPPCSARRFSVAYRQSRQPGSFSCS
jgi:integrase/recombinase XerD